MSLWEALGGRACGSLKQQVPAVASFPQRVGSGGVEVGRVGAPASLLPEVTWPCGWAALNPPPLEQQGLEQQSQKTGGGGHVILSMSQERGSCRRGPPRTRWRHPSAAVRLAKELPHASPEQSTGPKGAIGLLDVVSLQMLARKEAEEGASLEAGVPLPCPLPLGLLPAPCSSTAGFGQVLGP